MHGDIYFTQRLTSYAEVLIWALRTSRAVPLKNDERVLLRFVVDG